MSPKTIENIFEFLRYLNTHTHNPPEKKRKKERKKKRRSNSRKQTKSVCWVKSVEFKKMSNNGISVELW
jgi:hypothetical protein